MRDRVHGTGFSYQCRIESRDWLLIEAVAEATARVLCSRFPVSRVRVKVTKAPFGMPNVGTVAVECWRTPEDFREDPPAAGA